jgi:hypothetical protein
MKKIIVGLSAAVGAMLFCLAPAASAQDVVQFTGGYSSTFYGIPAGIYSGDVNGSSSSLVSDDLLNVSSPGEKWNATAIQASSLNSSNIDNTMFGKTIGLDGYAEVGTLVSMMFGGITSYTGDGFHLTGITQAEISAAIWDITTSGAISSVLDANSTDLVKALEAIFGNSKSSAAQTYLQSLKNLWILTPQSVTGLGPGEMWTEGGISMPEGGAALLYLLLAGFTCFGALFIKARQQSSVRARA